MQKEQVTGLARHILTGVGGYAVAKGHIDQSLLVEIVGVLSSVIGLVWSIFTKDKQIDHGYDPKQK